MSVTSAPLGHREVIEGLWRARALGRLPHALLFEGPAGIGKYHSALWFAQGLFCERSAQPDWSEPCGECGGCKRCTAGSHPDLFVLDPLAEELEWIPVARIAARDDGGDSASDFFSLRPMEGGMRIAIMREFDRANVQAQNALLKTLEEPGDSALIVLESARPDLLLATVRSRCVVVRFEALEHGDARAVLGAAGAGGSDAEHLVDWAEGSPGKAMALEKEGAVAVRQQIAAVLSGEVDPLVASQQVLELPGEFGGKTSAAQVRTRTRAALQLLIAVLRDGLHHAAGVDRGGLAHGDLVASAPHEEQSWRYAMEQVVALSGEVELNLTPLGILDRAFLALPRPSR